MLYLQIDCPSLRTTLGYTQLVSLSIHADKLTATILLKRDIMSADMDTAFSEWLNEEMNKRGWSQSDLARAAGISRQAVSDYINQKRTTPTPEALTAIAHGLKIPIETAFRAAGLLPTPPEWNPTQAEWEDIFGKLSLEDQEELLQIARLKLDRKRPHPKGNAQPIKNPSTA